MDLGNLFTIVGIIKDGNDERSVVSGYLIRDLPFERKSFEGYFGAHGMYSPLNGQYLSDSEMRFQTPFAGYEFAFDDQKGLWIGSYISERFGRGSLQCEIASAFEDWKFRKILGIEPNLDRGSAMELDRELGFNEDDIPF